MRISVYIDSGQIIATSHDLTLKDRWGGEIPLFQENPGWWNIIIWLDRWPPEKNCLGWFWGLIQLSRNAVRLQAIHKLTMKLSIWQMDQYTVKSMDSGLKYDPIGEMFLLLEPKVMRRSTLQSHQNLAADVNVGGEWDIPRKLDYQMPEWCYLRKTWTSSFTEVVFETSSLTEVVFVCLVWMAYASFWGNIRMIAYETLHVIYVLSLGIWMYIVRDCITSCCVHVM